METIELERRNGRFVLSWDGLMVTGKNLPEALRELADGLEARIY